MGPDEFTFQRRKLASLGSQGHLADVNVWELDLVYENSKFQGQICPIHLLFRFVCLFIFQKVLVFSTTWYQSLESLHSSLNFVLNNLKVS